MTFLLARVPLLRVVRTPRAWLPIALWTLLAIVSALLARSRGSASGADHVMRGSFAVVVLPLVSYATVGAVIGGAGLRRGLRGLVAIGAAPRRAALASIGVAVALAAVACALLAVLVCVLAHGAHDLPLARDLPTALWIGALGGGAYAAYFCAGAAIGKGTMRGVFLVFDWIVGSASGFGALFTPRGHLQSLLGGPLCADVTQRVSSLALLLMVCVYAGLALAITRRP